MTRIMVWGIYLLVFLFAGFAAAIMSYVAMAAAIGPWIETTLVLAGMLVFSVFTRFYRYTCRQSFVGIIAAAGGIGGILATACAFTIPALYFIDHQQFDYLLARPLYFIGQMVALSSVASSFGFFLAYMWRDLFIEQKKLAFPIGELVYKMTSTYDNKYQPWALGLGFCAAFLGLIIQVNFFSSASTILVFSGYTLGFLALPAIAVTISEVPLFISIGFITGHVIALPLFIGLLVKLFVLQPLYAVYPYLHNFFLMFAYSNISGHAISLSYHDFLFAFCGGLVIQGVIASFFKLLKHIAQLDRAQYYVYAFPGQISLLKNSWANIKLPYIITALFLFMANMAVFWLAGFHVISSVYLLIATAACTYQLLYIAGEMGLAPLGRFATFVMAPGMLLFRYSPWQAIFVAAFVEIAGGVACDVMFGYKMAYLSGIPKKDMLYYQLFGLLVSICTVAIVFWLLIKTFGLGMGSSLPVSKAAARALLVNARALDWAGLVFGLLAGYILNMLRVSPALVLGGILMPSSLSLMLVAGGLLTYFTSDREAWYPLLSGIFAASSLWMLLRALYCY